MRIAFVLCTLMLILLASCGSDEETPLQPLAVVVTMSAPDTTTFTAGDYVSYNTTITNAGRNATFEISIETVMQDKKTGKVLARRSDKTSLDGAKTLERSIQIPESASGTIEMRERVKFDNSTEEAFFAVDVKALPKPEPVIENSPLSNASSQSTGGSITGAVSASTASAQEKPVPKPKSDKPQPNGLIRDVTIDNYTFFPQFINITPGTTIRWTNIMRNSQSVAGPGFDSEPLGTGKTFEKTFYKEQMISYGSSLSQAWGEVRVINTTSKKYDALEEFFKEGK